jgi:hypothetical protein
MGFFLLSLNAAGVSLQGSEDILFWTGGDASGIVSVKNIYNAILSTLNLPVQIGWKLSFWKWNFQLKMKLFI